MKCKFVRKQITLQENQEKKYQNLQDGINSAHFT